MCFSYDVFCYSIVVYNFTEVFLPLQSYWSLFYDHGLYCIAAIRTTSTPDILVTSWKERDKKMGEDIK